MSHFNVHKMGFSEKNKSYHSNPAVFWNIILINKN